MRWTPGRMSRNIEDRRGGGGGIGMMGPGMGIGGVVLLVLGLLFGGDVLNTTGGDPVVATTAADGAVNSEGLDRWPEERRAREFTSFVLDDVKETWGRLLPRYGTPYREARLVLFRNRVNSACGNMPSAAGPFYCPVDEKAYID